MNNTLQEPKKMTLEHRLMLQCSEVNCMTDLFLIIQNEGLDQYEQKDIMKAFRWSWEITEFLYPHKDFLKTLLPIMKPFNHFFMTSAEKQTLNKLPNKVWIYRGGSDKDGLSWTLSKTQANWFKERNEHYTGEPMEVFSKQIHKNRIFAYVNGREEKEIILL
jgi:hypothetical protein